MNQESGKLPFLKIVFIIGVVFSQLINFTQSLSAQEASTSAEVITVTKEIDEEAGEIQKEFITDAAIKSLTQNPTIVTTHIEKVITVHDLPKKTFLFNEKIPVTIDNETIDSVTIEVFDVNGMKVDTKLQEISFSEPAKVKILPPNNFRPGRYRLKITNSEGKITTQDFSWGTLILNTNKSVYRKGEAAKISMMVFDEIGNALCNADMNLTIINPEGVRTEYSNENSHISVNKNCHEKKYRMNPDYEILYTGEKIGLYEIEGVVKTEQDEYQVRDSFEVQESVPFDIEWRAHNRIFPPLRYPVVLSITAHQDFTGEISGIIPDGFQIGSVENVGRHDILATRSASTLYATGGGRPFSLSKPFLGEFGISQGFGEGKTDPLLHEKYKKMGIVGHDGIDFDVPSGTVVVSTDDGIVVGTSENGEYGMTVIIQHEWGKSYYGHLDKISAQIGDFVKRGDLIGLSGETGLSTGPHLHFAIKLVQNDSSNGYVGKINPLPFFESDVRQKVAGISSEDFVEEDTSQARKVVWNVSVKSGQKIVLGFSYGAPLVFPKIYTLGPLEFKKLHLSDQGEGEKAGETSQNDYDLVFKEERKWHIGVDSLYE